MAAAREGLRVRVIDMDMQGTASDWFFLAKEDGPGLPFEVQTMNVAALSRGLADKGVDVAFIDTPPGQGAIIDAAIDAANFVVVASGVGGRGHVAHRGHKRGHGRYPLACACG